MPSRCGQESALADQEHEPGADPSVEDLIEQIRGINVGQFLLSTVSTLASLTYGKLDSGDLEQARVGIEALRALVPVLEGQIEPETLRDLQSAVANLQVAYTDKAG
jgi:hypothetical protein